MARWDFRSFPARSRGGVDEKRRCEGAEMRSTRASPANENMACICVTTCRKQQSPVAAGLLSTSPSPLSPLLNSRPASNVSRAFFSLGMVGQCRSPETRRDASRILEPSSLSHSPRFMIRPEIGVRRLQVICMWHLSTEPQDGQSRAVSSRLWSRPSPPASSPGMGMSTTQVSDSRNNIFYEATKQTLNGAGRVPICKRPGQGPGDLAEVR